MRHDFIHMDVFIHIEVFYLIAFIIPLKYFIFLLLSRRYLGQHRLKFWTGELAQDKMRNCSGWYGFIGAISTSTTDISLKLALRALLFRCVFVIRRNMCGLCSKE